MTYRLPFGLKQKPVNKYFQGGVIKFSVKDGRLYYTIKLITKIQNSKLFSGNVRSKEHLDKLLSIKSISEIPTIEVVN